MVQILSETITHYELRIDIIKRVKTGKVKRTLPVIDGGSIPLPCRVTYFKIKRMKTGKVKSAFPVIDGGSIPLPCRVTYFRKMRVKTGKVKSTFPVIDGGSIPPAMVPLTGLEPV